MKIVDLNNYRPRIVDSIIENYLHVAKAICVEGPKWCGKTWASSYHAKSELLLGDPTDKFQNRMLAQLDPKGVLEGDTPRLIDEWQEVPEIWDAVRMECDKRVGKGQFILTGSSTPKMKGVMHSGTGRIVSIKMHTMSLYESGDSTGDVSLKDVCDGTYKSTILTGDVKLKNLAYLICRGGWPDNIGVEEENVGVMPKSYIDSVVERDIQRLDEDVKYDIFRLKLLLSSLARNESTTVACTLLSKDIFFRDVKTLSDDTISKYLAALDRLFLLENQKPFSPSIRSSLRIKQAEKRHFCDPALSCAILGLNPTKLINDLETFGFMFEALVERDLRIYAESFGAKLYHYQDYKQNEIDAVIEMEDGEWCAIEVKLGANQVDKAAENLIKIGNKIKEEGGKAPKSLCVICGLSNAAYKRPDGVCVIPITALKN